ncbi:hypothetical protein [Actinoplanes sp. NPDC020271]|uniref:hypothetical protein n=1 Tax=Actinoplanes sp. NPDC020271 TaxID=3363896 RepID=UPI0037944EED
MIKMQEHSHSAGAGLSEVSLPKSGREVFDELRRGMGSLPFYWTGQVPLAPVVMEKSAYAEVHEATVALLEILKSATWELGRTAIDRNERLGENSEFRQLFTDEATEWEYATWEARPDVVLSEHGPKFIEFNVSVNVGGITHTETMSSIWAGIYGDAIGSASSFAVRADALERLCDAKGLDRSIVLIVEEPRLPVGDRAVSDAQIAYLRRRGFRAEHMTVEALADHASRKAARFGVAIREYTPQDRLDDGVGLEAAIRAHTACEFTLMPFSSYHLSNNQVLALISEGMPWMDAAKRALVNRFVPWSRVVRDGAVERAGAERDLRSLLVAEQNSMVLKRGVGGSGRYVVLGRSVDASAWSAAVDRAMEEGRWIVQEFVEPVTMKMPFWEVESSSVVDRGVPGVISPFVIDGRDAGCLLRYTLDPSGRLVSFGQPGVRLNNVMTLS